MSDNKYELQQRLLSIPATKNQNIEGATEKEIAELETYAGAKLPAVYKLFLKHLGRSAGELFRGSDYAVSQRFHLRLREHAESLLKRSGASFTLPPTAFVFLMAQGYQFAFFHLDDGDDPHVYHFADGDSAPTRLDASLSGYFLRCLEALKSRNQHSGTIQ